MGRKAAFSPLIILFLAADAILSRSIANFSIKRAMERVELGNEHFLEKFPSNLEGKRLGLVINHTSCLPDGTPLLKALLQQNRNVTAIFSPEHGFSGTQEGGISVENGRFQKIPLFSLYGKTRRPTAEQMKEIDAFIYDIQDVGTRYYTYITTLKYVLEAAAAASIPVYVLDRPNPSGGEIVEGPILEKKYESFIGSLPIPLRYGLTCGELALMMKGEGWIPRALSLHVIKMKKWKRNFFWEETGLPWIPPSPNMPTPETAILYPGTGLFEALNLNEGRGTEAPFLQFGAPWLREGEWVKLLQNSKNFPVEMKLVTYVPRVLPGKASEPLYKNQTCRGVRIHLQDPSSFHSVRFALEVIRAIKKVHPQKLAPDAKRLNLLFGNDLLTRYLHGEIVFEDLLAFLEIDERHFHKKRKAYFLYPSLP